MFTKLMFILVGAFFVWRLFVYLRAHPEALSKKNLSKSFFTTGILTLLLIGFVASLVFFVKQ